MSKLLILSIVCLLSSFGNAFGQSSSAKKIEQDYYKAKINNKPITIFDKKLPGGTNTVTFSVKGHSLRTISEFRSHLKTYFEKIEIAEFDKESYTFTLKYTAEMQKNDLISAFDKYGINYWVHRNKSDLNIQNQ